MAACQSSQQQSGTDSAAAAAAVTTDGAPAWPLSGTKWVLKEIVNGPKDTSNWGKEIYMQFLDSSSQVRGHLGCNGFGGKFVATPTGELAVSDIMSTQMACPALNVENAFSQALQNTNKYTIEKDILSIQRGDSVLATFTATKQ
ncbi:META domain-containing protein [Chitinophaga rhizosphaerae]|uniref:META domain-containing protein n=1 Tax=Chitinophaga rhizosphaerae TaxID=1864947 RepID=UPI0013DFD40D|nr:META domain-containing protein [Chitinophaga rhizosphaerae]